MIGAAPGVEPSTGRLCTRSRAKAHRLLVGALGHRHALHAHRVARGIHHHEHVRQALVLLAHQVADGTAFVTELQHRRRAGLDAQLVFDADAVHVVALAERAVCVHQELRHDEQADALDALGCATHPRQHQVHDVLGHVVLAVGDEDLGAEDPVAAIRLRLGAGAHCRQVAAGLRLGQVHRAGPPAGNHVRDVGLLLLGRAGGEQGLDRAVGQQRAQREAHVGAVEHLDAGRADGLGQTLAAEVGRMLQALPAAFAEFLEGLLEAGGRADHAVLPRRRVLVAVPVERVEHAFAELGRFLEHGHRGVVARFLEARQCGDSIDVGQFLDREKHVLDRGAVAHGGSFGDKAGSAKGALLVECCGSTGS